MKPTNIKHAAGEVRKDKPSLTETIIEYNKKVKSIVSPIVKICFITRLNF